METHPRDIWDDMERDELIVHLRALNARMGILEGKVAGAEMPEGVEVYRKAIDKAITQLVTMASRLHNGEKWAKALEYAKVVDVSPCCVKVRFPYPEEADLFLALMDDGVVEAKDCRTYPEEATE